MFCFLFFFFLFWTEPPEVCQPDYDQLEVCTNLIGSDGGRLEIADDIASLDIPQGALDNTVRISLSIVSPEKNHPPLGDKFIISPVILLEPDGLQFKRPVRLTARHIAIGLKQQNLEVWRQSTGTNFERSLCVHTFIQNLQTSNLIVGTVAKRHARSFMFIAIFILVSRLRQMYFLFE